MKEKKLSDLPTEPGTAIGWARYYDGWHFGGAILDWDPQEGLQWWMVGFEEPKTPAQIVEMTQGFWVELGKIDGGEFGPPTT